MITNLGRLWMFLGACLLLDIGSYSRAEGGNEIADRLRWLGAEVETDADGQVFGIDFSWCPTVTESELALLPRLKHLSELGLAEVALTSEGIRHLSCLSGLKCLNLSGTKLTDADIRHLEKLTLLEELSLDGTAITDLSIRILTNLPSLKVVDLSSTRVSAEGVRTLRNSIPQLHITEVWGYSVTTAGGRGVLDTGRACFVFDGIRIPGPGGGSAGSILQVSKPRGDDFGSIGSGGATSGYGLGIWPRTIRATASRVDGVPTFRVGEHRIEVLEEGLEVAVNGQRFLLGSKKERIIVGEDGTAKRDDWQPDDAP